MLRLLADTDVWLQIVQDYRNAALIETLERMIAADEIQLVVPEQAAADFARNKERIVRESCKSLSGTFKRVRAAVEQFADGDERDAVLRAWASRSPDHGARRSGQWPDRTGRGAVRFIGRRADHR